MGKYINMAWKIFFNFEDVIFLEPVNNLILQFCANITQISYINTSCCNLNDKLLIAKLFTTVNPVTFASV